MEKLHAVTYENVILFSQKKKKERRFVVGLVSCVSKL
jgi:hypothetical protein